MTGAAGASGSGAPIDAPAGERPPTTAPGFMSLAPPMGAPLDEMGKTLTPPAPAGWTYYEIEGTACRDGSPAGFFLHRGSEPKLILYLEGGGACINSGLCNFNQTNVNESFAGDGSTLIGSAFGVVADRQQPGVFTTADHAGIPAGIFDLENPMNPVKGWSEIYIPYCSGDIHFGTRKDASVTNLPGAQQFVGYENMKAFVSRIVPTFAGKLEQVAISGSSAGSIGALLNASMLQDALGNVPVSIIADAGLPLRDMFWPTCLQKRFRDAWGLNAALAPDCKGCFKEDGSGLTDGVAEYIWTKHPNMRVAAIARVEDEIMRLFYSVGLNECANYDSLDPVEATIGGILDPAVIYPAQMYTAALKDLRDDMVTKRYPVSSFMMSGPAPNLHQILFRPDLYTEQLGGKTAAQFVKDFLDGKPSEQLE
jgi:hypothetical protein